MRQERAISPRRSSNMSFRLPARSRRTRLPYPTRVSGRHRRALLAAERFPELGHVLQYAVGAPTAWRVDVFLRPATEILIGRVLAPDLRVGNEEPLLRGEAVDCRWRTFAGEQLHERVVGNPHPAVVRDVLSQREISVQLHARQR